MTDAPNMEPAARCCSAIYPCSWQRHNGVDSVCSPCAAAARSTAPEAGKAVESPTPAAIAVDLIIDDLSDRSGLDGAWGSIDADIQAEIRTAWIAAIQAAYARDK